MRYSKQELIEGWNQKKLKNSNMVVIGSNNLASFILTDLIAMGFGNITRIGESSLLFIDPYKLNPDVDIQEIPGEILNKAIAKEFIGEPDFIIEASNSIIQKIICLSYAQKNGIPTISAACSDQSYSIKLVEKEDSLENILNFHSRELNQKDGKINAIVASGIIVDETRKNIMPLKEDKKITGLTIYEPEYEIDKKVLLVGAGAIGTFAGISLALTSTNVDVIDFDEVEESNLNRQVLFYDSIGKYKAQVMAEKLSKNGKFRAIVGKIDKNYKLERNYDIILSCVDNLEARYYLDWIAYKNKTPIINSGTSVSSGSIMPYVPGKTACLDCQTFKGISNFVNSKNKEDRSCYEPATIISNQIIGGLLTNKILRIFENTLETIKYDSDTGIKKISTLENCLENCEKNV